MRKLFNLMYVDGKHILTHINKFHNILIQLKNMNTISGGEVQVLLVMWFLPNRWETFYVSLSNSAPRKTLKMPLLIAILVGQEI